MPAIVLAAHAAMLPQGQWRDEFITFSLLRDLGWRGWVYRLVHWSPRPLSEILILGYWQVVQMRHGPLMAPVLAFAWAIPAACLLAVLRPWRRPGRAARWALALSLPALFLLAGRVAELWYWPIGALAYLPALGAAAFMTVAIAGPGLNGSQAWLAAAAALLAGGLSVEMGNFFALLLSAALLLGQLCEAGPGKWRRAAIMAIPLMGAMLLLGGMMYGRVAVAQEMMAAGTFHRVWPSLRAGLPLVGWGLSGVGETWRQTVQTELGRALLLMGSWAALRGIWPAQVSRGRIVALLVALAGTASLSAAGAFYQFGVLCCERHEAFRHILYLLMIVGVAGLLPRGRSRWRWLDHGLAAPALLAACVLVMAPQRLLALEAEYGLAKIQIGATKALFRSGADDGSTTLDFGLAPPGPLLGESPILPGNYSLAQHPPWFVQAPMQFFGKTKMVVRRVR